MRTPLGGKSERRFEVEEVAFGDDNPVARAVRGNVPRCE
jgi:hypothetical protein